MKCAPLLLLLLCAFILTLRGAASFAIEPEAPTLLGIAKLVVGTDSIEVTKNESLEGFDLIPGYSWSTIEETQFASLPGMPIHRNDHTRHIRTYDITAVEPKR